MFFKRLCDQSECEADAAIAEQERQQGRAFTDKEKAVVRRRGEHRFEIPGGGSACIPSAGPPYSFNDRNIVSSHRSAAGSWRTM